MENARKFIPPTVYFTVRKGPTKSENLYGAHGDPPPIVRYRSGDERLRSPVTVRTRSYEEVLLFEA